MASALKPQRPALDSAKVLDYVFLSEFDILRHSRYNIYGQQWAQPTERAATAAYFKLKHSHKEIQRLDVEIQCLWSYMKNEEQQFEDTIVALKAINSPLAHQVSLMHKWLLSVNVVHRE